MNASLAAEGRENKNVSLQNLYHCYYLTYLTYMAVSVLLFFHFAIEITFLKPDSFLCSQFQ